MATITELSGCGWANVFFWTFPVTTTVDGRYFSQPLLEVSVFIPIYLTFKPPRIPLLGVGDDIRRKKL